MVPQLQGDQAVLLDEGVDEFPQVSILGDAHLQLKIVAFRTVGGEVFSIQDSFVFIPQLVSELWVLPFPSSLVERTHIGVLHVSGKIVKVPWLNIGPLIILNLRDVLAHKTSPDSKNVLHRNQTESPDVANKLLEPGVSVRSCQKVVLLQVGPECTFEVCVTAENPGGAEDIFDTLDDGTLKITVEQWRIINVQVLQTLQGFLVSNCLLAGQEEEVSGDIDASLSGADDDKQLEEQSLLHHGKGAVAVHLGAVLHDINPLRTGKPKDLLWPVLLNVDIQNQELVSRSSPGESIWHNSFLPGCWDLGDVQLPVPGPLDLLGNGEPLWKNVHGIPGGRGVLEIRGDVSHHRPGKDAEVGSSLVNMLLDLGHGNLLEEITVMLMLSPNGKDNIIGIIIILSALLDRGSHLASHVCLLATDPPGLQSHLLDQVVLEAVVVNQDLAVIPPGRDVLGRDGEALHPLYRSDSWATRNINLKSVSVLLYISAATECVPILQFKIFVEQTVINMFC